MIELFASWLGPLLALLAGLGVTSVFAYSKGKAGAQRRAEALRDAEQKALAELREAAIQAGANQQVQATKGALDAQQNVNSLDRSAVDRELRDKWTRPE